MGRGIKIIKRLTVWVGVIAYFVVSGFLLTLDLNKTEKIEVEAIRAIPEMKLILSDVTLDEINEGPKRTEYVGNEMFLIGGNNEYYFDNVEIRGRGNASWLMDKRSYRIKLPNKIKLFGLGKIKKWAMISNYTDNSLMRNDLGYHVASLLYENYPIKGEFVKFVVDNEDLGLYYMSKLVTIGKDSIDLKDTLGILAEVDNVYCKDEELYRVASFSDCVSVEDVVTEDDASEALNSFMDDYNGFEKAVRHGDYEEAVKKVDMESFAKYFILSEFSSNLDAYVTSWYLYKDGREDKIHSVVGWDFDGAFGNKDWWERDNGIYSPIGLLARMKYSVGDWDDYDESVKRCERLDGTLVSPTMCYMVDMPEFRDLAAKIYREKLMGQREEVISYIRDTADYIRDEAIADSMIWGKGDFDEEIEYLIWWVEKRFDYFDDIFGGGWPEPVYL